MNRESTQPYNYASLGDLQKALLLQIRRFNKACGEVAAVSRGPISLDAAPSGKPRLPVDFKKKDASSMDRLELLRAQRLLLQNMKAQLATQFSGEPKAKAIQKSIDTLIQILNTKLNQLQEQISELNEGRINANVKRTINALVRELQSELKLKEGQISFQYFVGNIAPPNTQQANVAAEVGYILLKGIKDPDGYAHDNIMVSIGFPESYISGTGPSLLDKSKKSDKTKQHIYVTVGSGFKVPSKIRWTATVNNIKDLKTVVIDLLVKDGVINSSEKRELPIAEDKIQFAHDNIKSTTVTGNMIEVRVKDPNEIDETSKELLLQLKGLVKLENPRSKDAIRMKLVRNTGAIRFVFGLPGRLKGRVLSNDGMTKLKNYLNLNDDEVKRIKTALEDHEQ